MENRERKAFEYILVRVKDGDKYKIYATTITDLFAERETLKKIYGDNEYIEFLSISDAIDDEPNHVYLVGEFEDD